MVVIGRAMRPGAQQRGLSTPGWRADDRYPLRHSPVEHLKEITPIQQVPRDRNVAEGGLLPALPGLRRRQACRTGFTVESFDKGRPSRTPRAQFVPLSTLPIGWRR